MNLTSCNLLFSLYPWAVLAVKNAPANAGDIRGMGSIPGLGKSPGGGHGDLLQCSCLENPMDRGAWQASIHGVAESQTCLNTNAEERGSGFCLESWTAFFKILLEDPQRSPCCAHLHLTKPNPLEHQQSR